MPSFPILIKEISAQVQKSVIKKPKVFFKSFLKNERGGTMQVLYWVVFVIAVSVAIFSVQNSSAPAITIKFLLWEFQTSLIYTILGSIVLGILITLLCWISRAIRASARRKKVGQERNPV